jgi:hypothetical protein
VEVPGYVILYIKFVSLSILSEQRVHYDRRQQSQIAVEARAPRSALGTRDAPRSAAGAPSVRFAPRSAPKKMTSFPDEKIRSIKRTSDFNAFEGLRVIIWQGVKDDVLSTQRKGLPYFLIGHRPGEERRPTVAESRGKGGVGIPMKRVSAETPPERPFEATYADARGRSASFQIESRFLTDVVRRASVAPVTLEQAPRGRFLRDLRVDQLCSLLMRETELAGDPLPFVFRERGHGAGHCRICAADARQLEAGSYHLAISLILCTS